MKRDTEAWNVLEQLVQERTAELQQEITERKRAEEALRHSEEQYRTLIENAHEAIIVTQDDMLKFVNAATERISGYSRRQLLSIPFLKFVHPDDRETVQEHYLRRLQGEEELTPYDFKIVDVQGNHKWLRNNDVVIEWEGRPATLNFLTDITDQRMAEEGLRSYQEHLEDLVEARTTALQEEVAERRRVEEQLREANEQLRQANDSKDTFFAIISHDLRTPFTTLLGYAEMLTEHRDSLSQDHLNEGIWEIRRAAQRLYDLLENLLTWARLQRGNMEHHPAEFSVSAYVQENLKLFQSMAEQKQISLTSTVSESMTAYADAHMMHTVLRNLLSNALKFTPTGGKVKVMARKIPPFVYITVADSGIGMHVEEIDRALRPDKRVTKAGTAGEKGTGLGLHLCRELVEQNEGNLSVESVPGKGTMFTFTIPANRET